MTYTRWLWQDRIPFGHLTLMAGYEGSMKSTLADFIVAQATRGKLPGEYKGTPVNVLKIATEESWSEQVVPRLRAAGADLSRVYRIRPVESTRSHIDIVRYVDELETIVRQHDTKLIVFDPIAGVLTDVNLDKEEQLRYALDPVLDLAERRRLAVLGIKHFTKLESTDPAKLMGGNRAWSYIARSTLMVVPDPEDMDAGKILAVHKPSLCARPQGIQFGIKLRQLKIEDRMVDIPVVDIRGKTDTTAEDALRFVQSAGRVELSHVPKRPSATEWLENYLLDKGPTRREKVMAAAKRECVAHEWKEFSDGTLRNAYSKLSDRQGQRRNDDDGEPIWSLID